VYYPSNIRATQVKRGIEEQFHNTSTAPTRAARATTTAAPGSRSLRAPRLRKHARRPTLGALAFAAAGRRLVVKALRRPAARTARAFVAGGAPGFSGARGGSPGRPACRVARLSLPRAHPPRGPLGPSPARPCSALALLASASGFVARPATPRAGPPPSRCRSAPPARAARRHCARSVGEARPRLRAAGPARSRSRVRVRDSRASKFPLRTRARPLQLETPAGASSPRLQQRPLAPASLLRHWGPPPQRQPHGDPRPVRKSAPSVASAQARGQRTKDSLLVRTRAFRPGSFHHPWFQLPGRKARRSRPARTQIERPNSDMPRGAPASSQCGSLPAGQPFRRAGADAPRSITKTVAQPPRRRLPQPQEELPWRRGETLSCLSTTPPLPPIEIVAVVAGRASRVKCTLKQRAPLTPDPRRGERFHLSGARGGLVPCPTRPSVPKLRLGRTQICDARCRKIGYTSRPSVPILGTPLST
jgi:hypothetical protein